MTKPYDLTPMTAEQIKKAQERGEYWSEEEAKDIDAISMLEHSCGNKGFENFEICGSETTFGKTIYLVNCLGCNSTISCSQEQFEEVQRLNLGTD